MWHDSSELDPVNITNFPCKSIYINHINLSLQPCFNMTYSVFCFSENVRFFVKTGLESLNFPPPPQKTRGRAPGISEMRYSVSTCNKIQKRWTLGDLVFSMSFLDVFWWGSHLVLDPPMSHWCWARWLGFLGQEFNLKRFKISQKSLKPGDLDLALENIWQEVISD